jgi:hypothetical protein
MPTKSALLVETSLMHDTAFVRGTLHSRIGLIPVESAAALKTSHFSFSSNECVHHFEVVVHMPISAGIGRIGLT